MRVLFAAAIAAVALPAVPAMAQTPRQEYRENVRDVQRDCNRELRRADSRREYDREMRECRREMRQAQREYRRDSRDWRQYRNYDYNRLPRGTNAYYADQYYRDGRYYQERRLSRNDRIYRGNDGRYYCRRSDGTTGLIVGGVAGGFLGNALSNGRNATLGTLLGAAAGAALGCSAQPPALRWARRSIAARSAAANAFATQAGEGSVLRHRALFVAADKGGQRERLVKVRRKTLSRGYHCRQCQRAAGKADRPRQADEILHCKSRRSGSGLRTFASQSSPARGRWHAQHDGGGGSRSL